MKKRYRIIRHTTYRYVNTTWKVYAYDIDEISPILCCNTVDRNIPQNGSILFL